MKRIVFAVGLILVCLAIRLNAAVETVPASARILWTGTNASIPSGWTEDTDFTNRFLVGVPAGRDPGTNNDNVVHTHTESHTHTANSHNHSLTIVGTSSGTNNVGSGTVLSASDAHSHPAVNSVSTTHSISSIPADPTIVSMQPPFMRTIILKPDDGNQNIPDNATVFADVALTGFQIADGTGGSDNMLNRFAFGPVFNGSDGGGTGGAATHTHAFDHNHSNIVHTHSESKFGGSDINTSVTRLGFGSSAATPRVHHTATSISSDGFFSDTTSGNISAASSESAFVQLFAYQNRSGGALDLVDSTILPYTGTLSSIPDNWLLCDSSGATPNTGGREIKIVSSSAGDFGGTDEHTHSATAHSHTHPSHDHTFTFTTSTIGPAGSGVTVATNTHTHTSNDLAATTTTEDGTTTVVSAESTTARYRFREVAFVKLVRPTVHIKGAEILGGAVLVVTGSVIVMGRLWA